MKENETNMKAIDLKAKEITDSDNIFDVLAADPDLVEINLSDNKLTYLPSDLSSFARVTTLDISQNPFLDFERVANSLATLPSLIDLKINLSTQEEALLILNLLPKLLFLNGKSTREETHIVDVDERDIESISLHEEITNFNIIFGRISEKLKQQDKELNRQFLDHFQNLLKDEIENINKFVDNAVPNYIYATNVLSSKMKIFSFFKDKYLLTLKNMDPNSSQIIQELFDNLVNSGNFLCNIIFKLYPKIDEKTETLRRQLDEALKAAHIVDNEISGFEDKIKLATKERDALIRQHEEEKQFLLEKIERLEKENKLITEKLLKNARDIINTNNISSIKNEGNNNSQANSIHNNSNYNLNEKSQKEEQNSFQNFDNSISKSKIGNNVVIGPIGSRVLTIKMMKDIINEIYTSKVDFDKKCQENKMPRETMEQHMYTYLNQKYGLKNLIIEWATSIINGIKMYSNEDSDICLFGKILRNELEEDSRLVLQRLKATIFDLLSYFLKTKHPLKSNTDIKEMLNQRVNSTLTEEEWKFIVEYVYEKEDASNLIAKIVDHIRKLNAKLLESQQKKLTRDELILLSKQKEEFKIPYKDFQKILLDYQIRTREKYLKNFVFLFKKCDYDNNGIINEEEFVHLIELTGNYRLAVQENSMRLLNIVDPYNNKQITFSECVSIFSMEIVSDIEEERLSLLDKICFDDNITSRHLNK